MNGIHDMGGMHGFGPVIHEENEPIFHGDWERKMRVLVVGLARNKVINLDEFRYAVERVRPDYYLAFSYYERWLFGLLILLIEKNLLSDDEIHDIKLKFSIDEKQDLLDALTQLKYIPQKEITQNVTVEASPKFKAGDRVKTKLVNPKVHVRVPRYARGKFGLIKEIRGEFILPESNIYSEHPVKEPVYLVEFAAYDLWGTDVPRNDKVLIDIWESYLELANI